jgi:SAM-dependent methyltransferase
VTAPRIPERLAVAVGLIDVRPGQRILEIGGGRGIAAWLVCGQLGDGGRLVGIDRSAKAVAASRSLNAEYVERGVADFRRLALEDVEPGDLGLFDTVFCVNVNAFWTRPAGPELGLIRGMLRPAGTFHPMYTPPVGSDDTRIRDAIEPRLDAAGFRVASAVHPAGDGRVVSFVATVR